ncbi:MAG: DinB family protein [Dehalococcoidia bacterium]|nr:DinB family protein [Chloroflexi bacterium CFX7]MCK6565206.1 DinB family protein [Dehalococcoidia bacterium]NUQ56804.1 DinB family protein [Dehalococcoidia bacterium]RIL01966.1 MAG: hypothetical protein DCC78_08985 [bacterium]
MTTDPETLRIRSYLQSQAAEKSVEDLIARVEEGMKELAEAALAINPGARTTVPRGETWSPEDCLRHATGSDIHCARQILHVACTGELPGGEEQAPAGTFEEMLASHREALDSLYVHVREAGAGAFLDVKWEHPFFGELNWREWLLFLRIHAKDHARQLAAMAGSS